MKLKFYIDETGKPHIYRHDVIESEIVDFFNKIEYFTKNRNDGSIEAIGMLPDKRFLTVIFRFESKDTVFVITAYDIEDKELIFELEDYYESN